MKYRVEQFMVSNESFKTDREWDDAMIRAWGDDNAHAYLQFIEGIDHSSETKLMLNGYAVYKVWYFKTLEDAEYFVSQKEGKWRSIMMKTGKCVFSYGPLKIEEIS